MKKMLIVDDDKVTRELLREVFEKENFEVATASGAEDALQKKDLTDFPIIISDIKMLGMDGFSLLKKIKESSPEAFVILMTGFGNIDGAMRAIQEGAFDYISKPFQITALKELVSRALRQWQSTRSEQFAPAKREKIVAKKLIGKSSQILEVYKNVARAAQSNSSVLIYGESGTGKELVARAIFENSGRRDKKFIAVNCGALAEGLLESELFGHVKGAFTGAVADKSGLFEDANGGVLFLDEIGDISPSLQVKLLRVLQEGEYRPVGSQEIKKTDFRLISATHRNFDEMIKNGRFRDDLYYRLKVIEIQLPSLRSRPEDIPELAGYFLALYSEKNQKDVSHISEEAMNVLVHHPWPGNIRELEHCVERAVAMARGNILFPEDFSIYSTAGQQGAAQTKTSSLEEVEKESILKALKENNYNKSKTSSVLGIDRATLYRKAQRYGINLNEK